MNNNYNEIKRELINNEINRKVKNYLINKSDLDTYYKVGKMIADDGTKYGENIIKQYSIKLINELNKKYSERTLRRYRQFYNLLSEQNWSPTATNLSWSHWIELLSVKDINEIQYYIYICETNNVSRNELRDKVRLKEYNRLPRGTKNKIISRNNTIVTDFVKNPIMIKNSNNYEIISEKILQKLILEDIESFMKELGNSFSFIGSEYKIKLGNTYNYIDLLLFNYDYNCFVVIELKVTKLKKEHIGQIQVYMNYIDNNIRKRNQDKTIGIIICKKDNKYLIEYCSDDRVIAREYELV